MAADDGQIEQVEQPGQDEKELSPEEVEYLKGFQRVFVEDLGEELLMDKDGNLYDLDGNVIGQAASDGEDEEEQEDGRYFEEEDRGPEPMQMQRPAEKKQPHKLPPVAAPSSKQKRSHSP